MSKKNCPICDGTKVECTSVFMNKDKQMMYAKCPDCNTNFRVNIGVYNTRPLEDALRKQLEVAMKAIEIAKDVMRMAINPNAYETQYLIDKTYEAFRKIEKLEAEIVRIGEGKDE